MRGDLLLWYAARAAALSAFAVLGAALMTGMALRTSLLVSLARNRAVLAVHGFLSWFWIPLVAVHVTALLLDATARVTPVDLLVPFRVPYGTVAVGLGTIGLLALVLVGVTSALRARMSARAWQWIHRISYPMFGIFVVHAQLAGTDFGDAWVSVAGWAVLGGLLALAVVRAAGARVGAERG